MKTKFIKFINKKVFNTVLSKFLMSYIIILVISLAAALYIYNQFAEAVKEDALERNLNLLKHSSYSIEVDLQEVDRQIYAIANNSLIKALINKQTVITNENYYEIKNAWDVFPMNSPSIRECFVVIPRQDLVLSKLTTYKMEYFYDAVLKNYSVTKEIWNDAQNGYHFKDIYTGDGEYVYIVHSLPMESFNKPQATVITIIDRLVFQRSFEWVSEKDCDIYMYAANNKLIYSYSDASQESFFDIINDKESGYQEIGPSWDRKLVSFYNSGFGGYTYISVVPSSIVLEKVSYVQQTTVIVAILFLVLGIIMAWVFSYINAKPVNEMRKKIEQDMPLIQAGLMQKLLKGELTINKNLKHAVFEGIKGGAFNVLIVSITGYFDLLSEEALIELNIIKELIKAHETAAGIFKSYYTDIDESTVAFLMAYDNYDDKERYKSVLDEYARLILDGVSIEKNTPLKFSAGGFYKNLSDVYFSFMEAKTLLDTGVVSSDSIIIWNRSMLDQEWVYYFPIEMEQRLLTTVKSGNIKETKRQLALIYEHNFTSNNISYGMAEYLYNELAGSVYKVMGQISGNLNKDEMYTIYSKLRLLKKGKKTQSDPKDVFGIYTDIFIYISSCLKSKQKSQNTVLIEQIEAYIKENFTMQQLSLNYVSSQFNISDIYMSNFFKEHMGINFSDYVEKLRIEKSCEMLTNTSLTITEISAMVGYNSPHAFRRAFKRVKGILPTDIRVNVDMSYNPYNINN